VNELQNVVNNQNPLNLRVGNPDLGQSYNHNIFANISKINLEKSRTLFLFVTHSVTSDFIGNSTFLTTKDTLINNEIFDLEQIVAARQRRGQDSSAQQAELASLRARLARLLAG
jgi:hypothetical protein